MGQLRKQFEDHATSLPSVDERELQLYERHFDLLREWNEKINLVSRKSVESAFGIHYSDSLLIANGIYPYIEGRNVADLGTGAGFPGIIFAIRYPSLPVVLYEKSLKKHSFLSVAITQLGLTNVTLVGAMPKLRETTFLLGRAVFPREELFLFLRRHLVPGSRFAHNVGGSATNEQPPNGFSLIASLSYDLPLGAGSRRIEIVELVKI